MTSRDFVYWLQGYFEILDPSGSVHIPLGPVQVECIRKHLDMVFKHEIPKAGNWKEGVPAGSTVVIPPQHIEPLSAETISGLQRLAQGTRGWPSPDTNVIC